jgi:hypothetical protein
MPKATEQTRPNIHLVLSAMAQLEKHPVVAAYITLQRSLDTPEREKSRA